MKSDDLLAELRTVLVEEAMELLIEGMRSQMAVPERRARARVPRASKPRVAKTSIEQTSKDLLAYMRKNPASTLREIREGLGVTASDLQYPMRKLRESKQLATKGARSQMRYTVKG